MVAVIPNTDVALRFMSPTPTASVDTDKGADQGRRVIFSLLVLLLDHGDQGGRSASLPFVVPLFE
jgi:hypothetical protein